MPTKKGPNSKDESKSAEKAAAKETKSRDKKESAAISPQSTSDAKKTSAEAPATTAESRPGGAGEDFPVAGVGSSAGGLEALELFFRPVKRDIGVAFVLVQHQSPTQKSLLAELVSRFCVLPVKEITNAMKVEKNTVYVNPPQNDLTIRAGRLYLMEPVAPRGFPQPIDFFFRSLAEDRKEKAIGIVLSGTGSEGTLGLRKIKGEGGMVIVQDPQSAKYDGMPRSAISTGLVDYILPPQEMAKQIVSYLQHPFLKGGPKQDVPESGPNTSLDRIFAIVRSRTRHDFSQYKHSTVIRRIERRMAVNQSPDFRAYVRLLQETPTEVETLFKELLIGVTNFFRDAEAFHALEQKIIPKLIETASHDHPLRVWVPGCSTGEEAYSIAMLVQERLAEMKRSLSVQIFATDIDKDAIETARAGVYPMSVAADIAPERLQRFFSKKANFYHVKKSVREMIVFAEQNIITDPPFSKLDLVSCRNLLIYMSSELQKKIFPIFHYALIDDGYLLLGASETIGEFSDLFSTVDRKWKIFRKKKSLLAPAARDFYSGILDRSSLEEKIRVVRSIRSENKEITEKAMLENYAASAVLFNEKLEAVYFHGSTDKYLQPPSGDANWNILGMAKEGLKLELANAIRKAASKKQAIRIERIRAKSNGGYIWVNLTVRPVSEDGSQPGAMIAVFEPISPEILAPATEPHSLGQSELRDRIRQLEHELASAKEYLQTTIEEVETSNEELKSTNEELQSANEELQSTNEELETSKEEQQSVNEELITVNSELQQKIDALSKANDDMNNLLASTQIGTVFLDTDLNVQRFTPAATKIINLISTDVGRPVTHIVSNMHYDKLVTDVREVLTTLVPKRIEVQTTSGGWYSMHILPYRTAENMIEGVVVTFVEVTGRKRTETVLGRQRELTNAIMAISLIPLVTLDEKLNIIEANSVFLRDFRFNLEAIRNKKLLDVLQPPGDHAGIKKTLENALEKGAGQEIQIALNSRRYSINIKPIKKEPGQPLILVAFNDQPGK